MPDMTLQEVCDLIQGTRAKVVELITSGMLRAYDLNPGGKYRQYRITEQAVQDYRQRCQITPDVPPVTPRKQATPHRKVKRYV